MSLKDAFAAMQALAPTLEVLRVATGAPAVAVLREGLSPVVVGEGPRVQVLAKGQLVDGAQVLVPGVGTLVVADARGPQVELVMQRTATLLAERVMLAAALSEEILALERAKAQVVRADKLATVGQLSAGLAHELGTPLSVITGRAKMLAQGQVPVDQVNGVGRTIVEQADRMASFIRQLLDFARRREPKKATYDLRLIARQAVALLQAMANAGQVSLTTGELATAVMVSCDAAQMGQVLTNLIVNAVQATPPGGQVQVIPGAAGAEAIVQVKDTGRGIPAEHLARIFEPFFTTKQTGSGTGLGLSVAMGIVTDHGGTIKAESTLGVGTVFTVRLPLMVS
jgi:two-component system, NtrC family, sensor kinase